MMNNALDTDISFDDLKSRAEEVAALKANAGAREQLGVVIGGSLSEGLEVKLDRGSLPRRAGRGPLRRRARAQRALLLHDHRCGARQHQPDDRQAAARLSDPFLADIYQGTTTFGTVHLSPLLILEKRARTSPSR